MALMELESVELRGRRVALVPLAVQHAEALAKAAQDGELWRLWYTSVPKPEGMRAEIERRLGLVGRGVDAAVYRD